MAINLGTGYLVLRAQDKTGKVIDSMVNNTTTRLGDLSKNVGAAFTVAGGSIIGALGIAGKNAMSFGAAMAEVNTLGVENLGALKDAVKDVAITYGVDLTDAAKATYQAISAGASEMQTPKLLAEAAKAATAGVSDLTTAIELGTSVSNAYGKSIDDVSGVYDEAFTAVKMGVTTFKELSASVGKLSPAFVAAGLSSKEMFGSIAALTKGGTNTAESVTGLNAVIAGFQRQGESARLKTMGLSGALEWLKKTTGGSDQEMLEFLGSTEAMRVALSLTGEQADDLSAIMGEMKKATGATQEAFNKLVEEDPSFAWKQLKQELAVLSVEIGTALLPTLKSVLETVKPIIESVITWTQAHPDLTANIVLGAAALGAFMLTAGPILMILPGIVSAVGLLSGGLGAAGLTGAAGAATGAIGTAGLAGGFTALAAALGPLVIAGGLLALGAYLIYEMGASANETKDAFDLLLESENSLSEAQQRYIDQLRERGIVLDENRAKEMSYAELRAYGAQMEADEANTLARAWFEYYAGRAETEQEYAQMKNLMLNENITAEEAAIAVSMGLSEARVKALMMADKGLTDTMLEQWGIRQKAGEAADNAITDSAYKSAAERQAAFNAAEMATVDAGRTAAEQWADFWEVQINRIKTALGGIAQVAAPALKMAYDWAMGGAYGNHQGDPVQSWKGNAFQNGQVLPFARGGVVDQMSMLSIGNRLASIAERGPEAIMPLERGADGKLGVRATGGGGGITINGPLVAVDQVNVNSQADMNRLAQRMGDELMRRTKQTGRTLNYQGA